MPECLLLQVLFSLVSLGIPGALVSGPKTAAEVAVCIGPDTNVEWLDRLMMAAASKGMLNRSKISTATLQCASAAGAGRQVWFNDRLTGCYPSV